MKITIAEINTTTFDYSAYYKSFQILSDRIAAISTIDYSAIYKSLQIFNDRMAAISKLDYSAIYKSLQIFSDRMAAISKLDYSAINKSLQTLIDRIAAISTFDYSSIYKSFQTLNDRMTAISTLEKNLSDIELPENPNLESLSEIEIAQLDLELSSVFSDSINWQQNLVVCLNKWKDKNPVIAYIINAIFLVLLWNIISNFIFSAITSKGTAVREEPKAKAAIIYNIEINQTVQVVESVAYYYKVEIHREDSEEPITGWVSKRSLTPIQDGLDMEEETK